MELDSQHTGLQFMTNNGVKSSVRNNQNNLSINYNLMTDI